MVPKLRLWWMELIRKGEETQMTVLWLFWFDFLGDIGWFELILIYYLRFANHVRTSLIASSSSIASVSVDT